MTRVRSTLFTLTAAILSWLVIEFGSFVLLSGSKVAKSVMNGKNSPQQQDRTFPPFWKHPLWAGWPKQKTQVSPYIYDPYLGHRLRPDGELEFQPQLNAGIDAYGFVHNGDRNRPLIDDQAVNIYLLGGSSTMGIGATSNFTTISAYLERTLNSGTSGKRYRVINAGVGGISSPTESLYFMLEIVHYKPAAVIALDGFNDFWHAYPPSQDSADEDGWATPNRSYEQQTSLALANNLSVPRQGPPAVFSRPSLPRQMFFYTFLVFEKAYLTFASRSPVTETPTVPSELDPWRANAVKLRDRDGTTSHVPFVKENWLNTAGAAQVRSIPIAICLQPVAYVGDHQLTRKENELLDGFFKERSHIDRDDYENAIRQFYAASRDVIRDLSAGGPTGPRTRFIDLSGLFDQEPGDVFMDAVHYTDRGNELIAWKLLGIVRDLLPDEEKRPPH